MKAGLLSLAYLHFEVDNLSYFLLTKSFCGLFFFFLVTGIMLSILMHDLI